MSALAFEGEILGYGNSGCCSPCGNRRQVVNTVNGLHGDITIAVGNGLSLSISGNTITLVNTGGDSNSVSGVENIPNGAQQVTVTFDTPFDERPIITGSEVIKADAADPDVTTWGVKNLTNTGFIACLSGAVPNGNYLLHWEAQGAQVIVPTPDMDNAIVDEFGNLIVDANGDVLVY